MSFCSELKSSSRRIINLKSVYVKFSTLGWWQRWAGTGRCWRFLRRGPHGLRGGQSSLKYSTRVEYAVSDPEKLYLRRFQQVVLCLLLQSMPGISDDIFMHDNAPKSHPVFPKRYLNPFHLSEN